jgi:hypothetical protein
MHRVEEFIKRWAVRTGGKAVVETKAIHGTADFDTIKPGWMANTLEYKFTLYQPNSTTPVSSQFISKWNSSEPCGLMIYVGIPIKDDQLLHASSTNASASRL